MISNRCARKSLVTNCNSIISKNYLRFLVDSNGQNRKRETIIHPYLNEKIEIGLLPYVQAMLMARYIREDIDDYPVFLIK